MKPNATTRLTAYEELIGFLRDSIKQKRIPEEHLETVNTLINAQQSGIIQALEMLQHTPPGRPLHTLFSLLSQPLGFEPTLLLSHPHQEMTFHNYVNSSINKLSYKLAHSIAKGTSNMFFGVLYLYSDPGLGKTHLLSAIANEMISAKQSPLLLNVIDLELELIKAKKNRNSVDVHSWILQHDAILIDDIQDASDNFELQKDICGIIKRANVKRIPLAISGSKEIDDLANMDLELRQLATSGVTAQLHLPHHEHLGVIAKNTAFPIALPDDVTEYLAENITENVRQLIAAVQQLVALNEQTDTPISIDLARAVAPTEEDFRSTIPLLDSSHYDSQDNNIEPVPPGFAGDEANQKANIYKEMLASAQNEEEQCLALQIAVSEKIKELRKKGDTEEVAKLKAALEHLRAGEIREALSCASI